MQGVNKEIICNLKYLSYITLIDKHIYFYFRDSSNDVLSFKTDFDAQESFAKFFREINKYGSN